VIEQICTLKPVVNQFKHLDIYVDIHPFEETIVWLGNKARTSDGYINCSRIKSPFLEPVGHMIATQGP